MGIYFASDGTSMQPWAVLYLQSAYSYLAHPQYVVRDLPTNP